MLETAAAALISLLSDPKLLGLLALAVPIGMLFGIVPGLGGKLAIVLFIPFAFGMETLDGAVFLLAMHAVVHTGGSVPSILLGIPGTGPDAATIVDGYPMTLKGEAGRALGASLSASALGGVIGAVFLAVMLPILKPAVLLIGPGEYFFLAILGITFIAGLSGRSLIKGLITGCLGLMLSMVGLSPHTGEARFTMGHLSLWEGIDLVTAMLAIFAIPEMIALAAKGGATVDGTPKQAGYRLRQVLNGMRDVLRHRWLALRTALIGSFLGMMPGIGGTAAAWFCYAHAVHSSDRPERFGKGAVEGVIGPEAANNSKEGGSLLPTLFFGIPGSSGMAIMLGAFVVLGIQPGPSVLLYQLDLVWLLIWTLIVANVFAVVIFLLFAQHLSLVAFIPGAIMVPCVFCFTVLGSLLSTGTWEQLLLLVGLGALGWGFKCYDWPRPPFAIGLALGALAETSLHKATAIWGMSFLWHPGSLILMGIILASLGYSGWQERRRRRQDRTPSEEVRGDQHLRTADIIVIGVCWIIFAAMLFASADLPAASRLAPISVGVPALALTTWLLAVQVGHLRGSCSTGAPSSQVNFPSLASVFVSFSALATLILLTVILGPILSFPIGIFTYIVLLQRHSIFTGIVIAVAMFIFLQYVISGLMGQVVWRGLLFI